jgi:hypothetical protein
MSRRKGKKIVMRLCGYAVLGFCGFAVLKARLHDNVKARQHEGSYAGSATVLFNRDIVLIALSGKISSNGLCFPEFKFAFNFFIKTPSQDK